MVDTDALRARGRGARQTASTVVATIVLTLPEVGSVRDAVGVRTVAGVEADHGDAVAQHAVHRIAQDVGVGDGNRHAVRLIGARLIDQPRHLVHVEGIGRQYLEVHAHVGSGHLHGVAHGAPPRVPVAAGMLHDDDVHRHARALSVLIDAGRDDVEVRLRDEARARRRYGSRRHGAEAVIEVEQRHRPIALQVRLLVDAELGPARTDVGRDRFVEVERPVDVVRVVQIFLLHEAVERRRAVRTERQEDVDVGVGGMEVADGLLRCRGVVTDAQHAGAAGHGDPRLGQRVGEALTARVKPDVPDRLIDAHRLVCAGAGRGDQTAAAFVAAQVFVLAQIGQVADAVLFRSLSGVVGDHRNSGRQRPLDRVLEAAVGVGHQNPVGLRRDRLVDQLGDAVEIERVRAEDRHVGAGVFRRLHDAGLDRAPERVPGAARMLNGDEPQLLVRVHDEAGRCRGQVVLGEKRRTGGSHLGGRADPVSCLQRERLYRAVSLQRLLLIDTEQRHTVRDVLANLLAEVECAVKNLTVREDGSDCDGARDERPY